MGGERRESEGREEEGKVIICIGNLKIWQPRVKRHVKYVT